MFRSFYLIALALGVLLAFSTRNVFSQASGSESLLPIPKALEQGKVDRQLREKYKAEMASRDPHDRMRPGPEISGDRGCRE